MVGLCFNTDMTHYISTRGPGAPQSFETVLLSGMAPDGGLYIPETWPQFDGAALGALAGRSYADVLHQVLMQFAGGILPAAELQALAHETYATPAFDHPAIAPLTQIAPNGWLLELFHGPTLSFKDYALQMVGRLFDRILQKKGQRITIVGATSGDTGSAAIEACKGCKNIDIFILHPKGRTSEVQRRQMTSVDSPNVFNIALDGTFDDCQAMVKAMFADEGFRNDLNLSAVNSINWARIVGQMAYYIAAALSLGGANRPVSFAVPTGNFGNIFAGWSTKTMGLPVKSLTIASNRNDILTRFFETGSMTLETVQPSLSPSMDIQVSSNFERYLCELLNRDHDALRAAMDQFRTTGAFSVSNAQHEAARSDFSAHRCSDEETLLTMRDCYRETGIVIDPHTAVGLHAATKIMRADPSTPMIVLACAHPAKFPEAVEKATGKPAPVPPRLAAVMKRAEHLIALPYDYAKVTHFIKANAGR
jgi:threonine synthase